MQKYFLFAALFLLSCQNRKRNSNGVQQVAAGASITKHEKVVKATKATLDEFFADSCNIGRKALDKIEIARYSTPDSAYVVTRFYAKQQNGWRLRNEYKLQQDESLSVDPQLSDFNRDGFNDVTYESVRAARGANEVRKLFIYDQTNDRLIYIKNSEDYPNMRYNKELNCIDAFLVSGCNVTVFLKIEKDSLRELADVDQCDVLTVTTYDRKGKGKVILRKKTNRFDMTRFKNYRPLEEADD